MTTRFEFRQRRGSGDRGRRGDRRSYRELQADAEVEAEMPIERAPLIPPDGHRCPGAWHPERWAAITVELQAVVPERAWELYLVDVHPHRLSADGELVLAAPTAKALWTRDRFSRLLTQVCGREVLIVACDGLQEAS